MRAPLTITTTKEIPVSAIVSDGKEVSGAFTIAAGRTFPALKAPGGEIYITLPDGNRLRLLEGEFDLVPPAL